MGAQSSPTPKSSSCAAWPICKAPSQQRAASMESAWREMLLSQHKAFEGELQRASAEIQQTHVG